MKLISVVRTRYLRFHGPALKKKNCLEKDVLLGRIKGRQPRDRPRMKYSTNSIEVFPERHSICGSCQDGAGPKRLAFFGCPLLSKNGTSVREVFMFFNFTERFVLVHIYIFYLILRVDCISNKKNSSE